MSYQRIGNPYNFFKGGKTKFYVVMDINYETHFWKEGCKDIKDVNVNTIKSYLDLVGNILLYEDYDKKLVAKIMRSLSWCLGLKRQLFNNGYEKSYDTWCKELEEEVRK